jgi:hypothetical protein
MMSGNQTNRTWQADLVARFPHLFDTEIHGQIRRPGFPEVGDGWKDLVQLAIERIAVAVSAAPDSLRITQIKSKFATIRIYWWAGPGFTDAMGDAVDEAVELAEARSACTCETCGEPGRLFKHGGWFLTACETYGKGKPVTNHRPEHENVHVTWRVIGATRTVRARHYIRGTDSFVDVDPSSLDLERKTSSWLASAAALAVMKGLLNTMAGTPARIAGRTTSSWPSPLMNWLTTTRSSSPSRKWPTTAPTNPNF